MTKRKVLYAIIIGMIMLMALIYFMFLLPREHVYNGTLASNSTLIYLVPQL